MVALHVVKSLNSCYLWLNKEPQKTTAYRGQWSNGWDEWQDDWQEDWKDEWQDDWKARGVGYHTSNGGSSWPWPMLKWTRNETIQAPPLGSFDPKFWGNFWPCRLEIQRLYAEKYAKHRFQIFLKVSMFYHYSRNKYHTNYIQYLGGTYSRSQYVLPLICPVWISVDIFT